MDLYNGNILYSRVRKCHQKWTRMTCLFSRYKRDTLNFLAFALNMAWCVVMGANNEMNTEIHIFHFAAAAAACHYQIENN